MSSNNDKELFPDFPNKKQKIMFGKILGEMYRLQNLTGKKERSSPAQIYALLNGFEDAIDSEIEGIGFISNEMLQSVMDVLDPIWSDDSKMEEFKGFYDIENDLKKRGVDRYNALKIIKYLKANGQFTSLIEKMNSVHSPSECKTFTLYDWDV